MQSKYALPGFPVCSLVAQLLLLLQPPSHDAISMYVVCANSEVLIWRPPNIFVAPETENAAPAVSPITHGHPPKTVVNFEMEHEFSK